MCVKISVCLLVVETSQHGCTYGYLAVSQIRKVKWKFELKLDRIKSQKRVTRKSTFRTKSVDMSINELYRGSMGADNANQTMKSL